MASKKQPPKKDRHKSTFVLRIPEMYREAMSQLKLKTRRTFTVEVQIALDSHLKANGISTPDTST